jgi:hypothetical protein
MDIEAVLATQRGIDGMLMEVSAATWCILLESQHASWAWSGVKSADYLEIGTFKGKAASILAHFSEAYGNTLTIVDPEVRPEARENLAAVSSRVSYMETFSERLYHSDYHRANIRNLAWSHVDGMHSYAAILSDLKVCEEMTAEYGIVCIDDFHTDLYPQIPAATYRYLHSGQSDLSIFLVGFNKAYLCRNTAKPYFMRCVEDNLAYSLDQLGHRVTLVKTDRNDGFDAFAIAPFQGEARLGSYFTRRD